VLETRNLDAGDDGDGAVIWRAARHQSQDQSDAGWLFGGYVCCGDLDCKYVAISYPGLCECSQPDCPFVHVG
jgi:hypothetical protein